ncbi:MAG: type II methionyl aminopeptidase, partial [Planctomycetota bacterium]
PPPPAASAEARARFLEAGRIACSARDLGISMIAPGVLLREVVEAVEAFIREHGGGPAFPAQTSRNAVAAHYCPSPRDETRYEDGDVVKLDVGVEVDGYVADTAATVHLGTDPDRQALVRASRAGLEAALAVAGPGVPIRDLSAAIERAIEDAGFRPVYNLTGHGVGRWTVHTAPQVPPSPDRHDQAVLRPGMVVAIEPFATDGRGQVGERGRAEVFMLTRLPRKMKGIDPAAWRVIEGMHGLPFARRSFPTSVPAAAVEATLARLLRIGCLMAFPPLVDPDPSVMISQAEHTILVLEDGIEVTTARGLEN